jgi:hypothetical protein
MSFDFTNSHGLDPALAEDAKDPTLSQLSGDSRLPADPDDQDLADKRLKLAANTAAKMMRAAHQAQSALNRSRLFGCDSLPADPITHRDGVALQILKRLAAQVRKLEDAPLDEEQGETELERQVKIAQILAMMTKQQAVMEQNINKAVGLSTRASQEAAKLQFAMRAHKDKMELARGGLDAAEVERIADE